MTRILLFVPAVLTALGLAACAAAQTPAAPSLAKRAVEGRLNVAPPPVVVTPPGPLPADLAGRLARWEADGSAGQDAFAAARGTAVQAVNAAAGAGVSSESWVVAQQAISRLIAARAPLTGALADIDRLYIDRSVETEIDGLPDIYALRDRLAESVSGQDAVIEALSKQLPGQ